MAELLSPTKPATPAVESVAVKVDGQALLVPKLSPDWQGKLVPTTMLQACEAAGVSVPHYCFHARLPVAGNCRMCLVEFGVPALGPDRQPVKNADGSLVINRSPRPAISCATPVSPGMEIYTTTDGVKQMRQGVLEFLLINHPLDCPICDQAGECKLQEYSVEYGQSTSRFVEAKVHKPKAVDLGPRIMLDDERCILCTRCIRFTRDVVGDDALGILNRGSYNTIAAYPGRAFDNNYTLNTVDLCPVGALTTKDFRFQMRVWFLRETASVCASCATGCNITIGSREGTIHRFTPRENPAVNGPWMCDAGRLNHHWVAREDRLQQLRAPQDAGRGWSGALAALAEKLRAAAPGSVALVASARQTNEELFLLRRLAQHVGAVTDSVPRSGEADHLLVQADKNPNTTGARLLGLAANPMGANLAGFAERIRSGSVRTLIVFGEDVTKQGIGADLLGQLELLVVSDVLPNPTVQAAHFVLPGCAPAEKRGSFTNGKGRVQRFFQAIDARGDARSEVEFLADLLERLTGDRPPSNAEALFNQLAAEVPGFAGLTWRGWAQAERLYRVEVTTMMAWLDQLSPMTQFLLFSAGKVVPVAVVLLAMVAYTVLAERKICAAMQDRIGPNRAGPFGLLQPAADAVKAFLKEDFMPGHVRKVYYWLAPAIVMIPALVTIAVIPFGSRLGAQKMVIADLNVGVLYTFGIVSLGVYGIVLAGYAARSKYPFMGGIRSSAQLISYEIAMGMSVVPVFLLVGSLNLGEVIRYQSGGWFSWMIFKQPLAFAIFLAAAFAETNRLPFDLPEAEQELAGGYNVEYSSIKFALFFMGEYANMIAASAMMVTLFFGGWTLPWGGLDQPATSLFIGLLHIAIFLAKVVTLVVVFIWVRWMWPRFRYDQLMDLGWKRFVPLALANIVVTATFLWLRSAAFHAP